jgi:hypothetical protein
VWVDDEALESVPRMKAAFSVSTCVGAARSLEAGRTVLLPLQSSGLGFWTR